MLFRRHSGSIERAHVLTSACIESTAHTSEPKAVDAASTMSRNLQKGPDG